MGGGHLIRYLGAFSLSAVSGSGMDGGHAGPRQLPHKAFRRERALIPL